MLSINAAGNLGWRIKDLQTVILSGSIVLTCLVYLGPIGLGQVNEPKSRHWAFEHLPAAIPAPKGLVGKSSELSTPIDSFVAESLLARQLTMQNVADLRTLARRASLALTGRLPDFASVQTLVSSRDPEAYAEYVDTLVASPHFGEQAAIGWLALCRYADTQETQTDNDRDVWPFRDWVIEAFNQDLPYDQFVTWQLAGDMLPNPTDNQKIATAFNRLHRQDDQPRQGEKSGGTEGAFLAACTTDRVNTFGTVILGLTLHCARCHDHKYDPISQMEYYQLCDMFDNISESGPASDWTDATPSPNMLLLDEAQKQQVKALENAMRSIKKAYSDELKKLEASNTVEDWYASIAGWPEPNEAWLSGDFPLDGPIGTEPVQQLVNRAHPDKPGKTEADRVTTQQDGLHSAILLDGEQALLFPNSGVFSRKQGFTLCLELKVPTRFERAVVLHRTQSGSDAGSRGYELVIEDGHFILGVIHDRHSSAIRIRCKQALPISKWMHVAVVYGGTNSSDDTHLYIDGKRCDVDVLQDSLHKDILYEHADVSLSIGARKQDRGLVGGLVDHFQIYDSALTAVEVAGIATNTPWLTWEELSEPQRDLWREHYAMREDTQCKYHLESFRHYFNSLSDIVQNADELMVMQENPTNRPTRFLNRGAYDAPGEIVTPGVPMAMLREGDSMPTNRLQLARWLTSDHHPLTARVAVNHMWQQMFGNGLVTSSCDFGLRGQAPTHPHLLDYLAREFIRSGWSRKAIFRKMALSQAFVQSSNTDTDTRSLDVQEFDVQEMGLSHFPSRRLTPEQLREGAWQTSRLLSNRIGGPPIDLVQGPEPRNQKSGSLVPENPIKKPYRRSLYAVWKRINPIPFAVPLDADGREICPARLEVTDLSAPGLPITNDPQVVHACLVMALNSLEIKSGEDLNPLQFSRKNTDQAVVRCYQDLTSLECPDWRLANLRSALDEKTELFRGHPDQAAKLLSVGNWQPTELREPEYQAKIAALTFVIISIMNSDEFAVMR
jgi:hypothetical protein